MAVGGRESTEHVADGKPTLHKDGHAAERSTFAISRAMVLRVNCSVASA